MSPFTPLGHKRQTSWMPVRMVAAWGATGVRSVSRGEAHPLDHDAHGRHHEAHGRHHEAHGRHHEAHGRHHEAHMSPSLKLMVTLTKANDHHHQS